MTKIERKADPRVCGSLDRERKGHAGERRKYGKTAEVQMYLFQT